MDPELIARAEALGINATLYWLLPPEDRERDLRRDVERAEREQKEEGNSDEN